ncbi:MAG: hypothetical protein ACI8W8_003087 [Rhodothermales bacterium]|jgi:hypothetical protein
MCYGAGGGHAKTEEVKKKEAAEAAEARKKLPSDVLRLLVKVEEHNTDIEKYTNEYLREYSSSDFSKVDRLRNSRNKYFADLEKKIERHRKPFEKKVEEIEAQIEKLFELQSNAPDKAKRDRYAKEREETTEERYAVREAANLLNNTLGDLREIHAEQPSISKHSLLGRKAPRLKLEGGDTKTDLATLGKDSWLYVFLWTKESTSGFSKHVYSDKSYAKILPLKVIGINADRGSKDRKEAAQMMTDNKWANTFEYGDRVLRSFKVDRANSSILIDPKGIVRQVYLADPGRNLVDHLAFFRELDGPPPEAEKSESESEKKVKPKRNPFARGPAPDLGAKK